MPLNNLKKGFWKLFKWVTLISVGICFSLISMSDTTFGINKTVGWAWDITNFQFWLGVIQFIVVAFLLLSLITLLVMKLSQLIKK